MSVRTHQGWSQNTHCDRSNASDIIVIFVNVISQMHRFRWDKNVGHVFEIY